MPKEVDPKVYELAEYFLQDVGLKPQEVRSLAVAIQDAVENWFAGNA